MSFQGFFKWSKDVKIVWWWLCASTPHGVQSVLNSLGNMGMGIDMQQDDVINEFISKVFLDLGMQLLRHMTVTVGTFCVTTWWVHQCQRTKSVLLYQWVSVTWISSFRVQWDEVIAYLLVSLLVQSGKTTSHCPTHSITEKHHPHCVITASFPAVSRFTAVCICLSRHGTHWEHTLWYPISSRIAHTVLMLMVSSIDGKWSACLSLPTAFLTNLQKTALVKNAVGKERHVCHSLCDQLEHT